MRRFASFPFAILAPIQFILAIALTPPSLAQEWELRVKPHGTLKVVDLRLTAGSACQNYAEGLVTLDKDNKWTSCLAKDWRWIDDRTIEFRLREDVRFHNGEEFNAEAERVNWEAYKRMKSPRPFRFTLLPDETKFEIIDERTVRFTFPEPDGLAFVKFRFFFQVAPAYFAENEMVENNWGYLSEPGPWGTGPFKLVEGSSLFVEPSDRVVLKAYEDYWDPRYPKVQEVIFDTTLIGKREEAMRLCREQEGAVDIVNHIRPLDTLKVAESPFAKVVKSRDATLFRGGFNQRKTGSKWLDVRLRKAINYAVNREELWKYASKGNAHNLGGYIPTGEFGHNPDLDLYSYDTTKARALLAQAGYPEGFELKVITFEAWKLEAKIICKMLERIGLKVSLDVLTHPEFLRKVYVPILAKPPEEQEWDLELSYIEDWYGHTGSTFLSWGLLEESEMRWIDYDQAYEKMWKDMAGTVNLDAQEAKVRQLQEYIYDQANLCFIYSPLTLYAVNKEVDFVPQRFEMMRLKETSVTDSHWSVRGESSRSESSMNLAWDEIWPLPEGVE